MTDKARTSAVPAALDSSERNKLLMRVGLAVGMIVLLIGALALFEQAQRPPQEPAGSQAVTGAVPSEPKPAVGSETGGTIPKPEAPAAAEAPAEPERTAAPEQKKPESVDRQQAAPEDSHPRLVVGRGEKAADQPAASAPPAKPRAAETPAKAPRADEMPKAAAVEPVPPAAPAAAPSAAAKPLNGFLVQVGVFSNVANAEELRRKLTDAGIPAHIEARVQVGPFASQAEAAAAQQKIRALGMEPGMVLPPRKP